MIDFHSRNRGGYPKQRRDHAEEAKARQEGLLERIRAAAELRTQKNKSATDGAVSINDQVRFDTAIGDISLRLIDSLDLHGPSAPYRELAQALNRVVKTGKSEAVLCWPASNVSVAAVHTLASLAAWQDCDSISVGTAKGLAEPNPLRALFYPWSPRTRLPLRNVYACKSAIHRIHQQHIQRYTIQRYALGSSTANPMYDLHLALLRVEELDGSTLEGVHHPEFRHPNLNELVPSGPCGDQEQQRTGLLHRVRSKTQLKYLLGGKVAEDPSTAPYYLFGVQADSSPRASLRRLQSSVHVILLDLTKSGKRRLAQDWREPVRRFLAECRTALPGVPTLAITDDPWVHRDLMWGLLKEHEGIKGKRPAGNSAIFTTSSAIAAVGPGTTPEFKGCTNIRARGFAGNLDGILESIRELKARANRLQDVQADTVLGELAALLRRCSNLPGGVADLGSYVADEAGDVAAVHIMAAYEAPKILAQIERLEGSLAQSRREQLNDLCRKARAAWETQQLASPMSSLLVEELKPLLRNSSKTVVLFRKSMLCDYAKATLVKHSEIGELVQNRFDKGVLSFIDEIGLRETTGLPPRERAQVKTLILVSPTRSQLLSHMTIPWLPEREIILSDAETLRAVARDAQQLSTYPAFTVFATRLRVLAVAAQTASDEVFGQKVVLDDLAPPPGDIDFPTAKLIDLSGGGKSGQELLVKLETDDRQTIVARQRTKLVAYDADSAVPTYRPLLAREAEIGDNICVISDDFVDMARTRLDITCAATEEIRAYHLLVSDLFSKIPGVSDRARRQELARLVNDLRGAPSEREVNEENIRYWVDLADELNLPLQEVTPHAPQDQPTFLRLTAALGIAAPLANYYWQWAVIGTRSNRLKAAHRLHDAYLGILISPHSAESEHPRRVADIRALRAAAEGFISRVSNKTMIERAELCAS
jgi:hypothetical protein